MTSENTIVDPYQVYAFKVSVNGLEGRFNFTKCSGISVTFQNQEYIEAGNMFKHQMPGRVNYDPITLSYGVTTSRDLWMWILDTAAGKIERRNVTISMQDSTGTKVQDAWELVAAWPQKWQGGELDASAGEIALSELTLVYDELKRRTG